MPIAVLFALNAADELDTYAFGLLGPEIARHFGIGVGLFGAISVLVVLLCRCSSSRSPTSRTGSGACRWPSRPRRRGARSRS